MIDLYVKPECQFIILPGKKNSLLVRQVNGVIFGISPVVPLVSKPWFGQMGIRLVPTYGGLCRMIERMDGKHLVALNGVTVTVLIIHTILQLRKLRLRVFY